MLPAFQKLDNDLPHTKFIYFLFILQELELKKPWMTDEIRSEIQKKNKLYAKAKKNKDAKEWNEFKDLRNKVTRMIRDAKNEYLTKNPEQVCVY